MGHYTVHCVAWMSLTLLRGHITEAEKGLISSLKEKLCRLGLISAPGILARDIVARTFHREAISSWRLFGKRTFHHKNISAWVFFGAMDVSVRGRYGTGTFWHPGIIQNPEGP